MKIRNDMIVELANVLYDLKLSGKESRMRTRFRKLLAIHQNEVIAPEKNQLIEEYANRDENGKIIYPTENSISVKDGYYKAYEELMNECFIIDNTESNKEMLITVANIMLNTDYEFSGDLADIYDIWCEEFEKVIEYYNGEEV